MRRMAILGRFGGVALLAGVIVAVLPALAAGGGTRASLPCPPRGEALIAHDAQVRVYRPKVAPGVSAQRPVSACLVGHRSRMTLIAAGRPQTLHSFPGSLGTIVLSRTIVAYVVHRLTGVDTASSELFVADVAARRVLREARVGSSVDAGFLGSESLTALVANPAGAVAWIDERVGPRSSGRQLFVYAAPPVGHAVLLDEGTAIDPASLTLSGGTLCWSDGGSTRTAHVP
jgi:hypothetical protein